MKSMNRHMGKVDFKEDPEDQVGALSSSDAKSSADDGSARGSD